MRLSLQLGMLMFTAQLTFAACPNAAPRELPATRGALVNPDGSRVKGQVKFYRAGEVSPRVWRKETQGKAAATVSTDNQGAFDFTGIPGGAYYATVIQKGSAPRTLLLRIPAKPNSIVVVKKEIWLKLKADDCPGFEIEYLNHAQTH